MNQEEEHRLSHNFINNINDGILHIYHDFGFFSNCSILLYMIIRYHNIKKMPPLRIDNSGSFTWYRPKGKEKEDVFHSFFKEFKQQDIIVNDSVQFHHFWQYSVYKNIPNIDDIIPYIKKYFSPTDEILDLVDIITEKYKIDYDNTCVLFYRGNDKSRETPSGNYNDFFIRANNLNNENNDIRFLIQSDETEFIHLCKAQLSRNIVFENEIRHIKRNIYTSVDVQGYDNYKYAKYFLAIMIIMSKCKHVICNSGNISLWLYFFRYIRNKNNMHNFQQCLKDQWY